MATSESRRLVYTAIVLALVGIITGLLVGSTILSSGEPPTRTFNIVAYHWGYTLHDENWNEIEKIEVERGSTVRLIAYPPTIWSQEKQDEFIQIVLDRGLDTTRGDDVIESYAPGDPRIVDFIEEARSNPDTANHGVFIAELDIDLGPRSDASTFGKAIDSVEFTADALGEFDISCSVDCGPGHELFVLEKAFVVK